jgi:3-phosphoshikimate 1-carboxyvinyltransferase
MASIKITPIKSLNGEIVASPSKSYSHRAFVAASLAEGVSIIKNPLTTGDVKVTMDILKLLGVKILESKNSYIVDRSEKAFIRYDGIIDCKNSGTSIRLFSALSLLIKDGLSFTGEFLKRKRPILPLLDALKFLGADYNLTKDKLFIKRINDKCETVKIQGDISSQFITALLIISSLLKCENKEGLEIEITTHLVSYPYIKITLDVLSKFGINIIEKIDDAKIGKYYIPFGQKYRPQSYEIPGDFSSAAFIMAAAVLSPKDSKIIINNLNIEDPQGDKRIIEILQKMGANIQVQKEIKQVIIQGNLSKYPLKGLEIDCNEIPDLFPILCVVGAISDGKTVLYNASNLRLKESDRIAIMSRELNKMGVKIKEDPDKLTIYHSKLKGSTIDHENDHRIAMACTIAALYSKKFSNMNNIDIVEDSYPTFFDDLIQFGAKIQFIS